MLLSKVDGDFLARLVDPLTGSNVILADPPRDVMADTMRSTQSMACATMSRTLETRASGGKRSCD
jgi:hypothetical protein